LNKYFSYEELRLLIFELGIEFEDLPGASKREKSRELIVFLERQGRLSELIQYIRLDRPDVDLGLVTEEAQEQPLIPTPITGEFSTTQGSDRIEATGVLSGNIPSGPVYQRDLVGLQNELATLRQSVLELNKKSESDHSSDRQIDALQDEIIRTLNRAVGRTEDLKADLILPEDRGIRLIMEHDVDRLEEYRSDENIAFLLIGLFAGAAVGIIVNWATDSAFAPTPISITLLLLFALLAIGASLWSYRLKRRVSSIYKRIPQASNSPLTKEGPKPTF
jgi:hypothetical protein